MGSRIAIGIAVLMFFLAMGVAVLLAVGDRKAIEDKVEISLQNRAASPNQATLDFAMTGDRSWQISGKLVEKDMYIVTLRPGGGNKKRGTIHVAVADTSLGGKAVRYTGVQLNTPSGAGYAGGFSFESKIPVGSDLQKELLESVTRKRTFPIGKRFEIAKVGTRKLMLHFIP